MGSMGPLEPLEPSYQVASVAVLPSSLVRRVGSLVVVQVEELVMVVEVLVHLLVQLNHHPFSS